ncbi:hypothetical protein L208DRAFT_1008800, partial [Tricholoma matsutake]
FHLCSNLVWALLHVHCGHINLQGSLSHWFTVLEKTHLGAQHPDYHSLLSAFMQIPDGLILDAWQMQCGFPSLAQFVKSN